jgi:glucans biosynthesis protein
LPVSIANSLLVLSVALLLTGAHAANAPAPDKPPATYPFTFDTLLADAKRRAAAPYTPQHNRLPAGLDKLSPEQYRSIRFNPDAGIWRAEQLPFHLELLRASYAMQTVVTVSTIENGEAHDVVATPAMFQMESALPAQLGKMSLPLSGFRVRSRINSNKVWDEFLVFQGASYFRAVAKKLLYGLSARGLAINTAEPAGCACGCARHLRLARKRIDHGRVPFHRATGRRDADRCGPHAVSAHGNACRRHRTAHIDVPVRRNQPRASR